MTTVLWEEKRGTWRFFLIVLVIILDSFSCFPLLLLSSRFSSGFHISGCNSEIPMWYVTICIFVLLFSLLLGVFLSISVSVRKCCQVEKGHFLEATELYYFTTRNMGNNKVRKARINGSPCAKQGNNLINLVGFSPYIELITLKRMGKTVCNKGDACFLFKSL